MFLIFGGYFFEREFGELTGLLLEFVCDAGGTLFDASQYAFFGKDVVEEVELGGLEEEEDTLPVAGIEEEEFLYDREEVK